MARVLAQHTPQPLESWFGLGFGVLMLSLLGWLMARTMEGGKYSSGGGEGSSAGGREEVAAGKRPMEGESSGAPKKKKSTSDHKARLQKKWQDSIEGRPVTCERQVDNSNLATHPVIRAIERRGLHSFFNPVEGFVRPYVYGFYASMKVLRSQNRIEGNVRGKKIIVTPDSIAEFLKFPRPSAPTFPPVPYKPTIKLGHLKKELLENPQDFNGKFYVGKLTEEYRMLNKVIHYNIFPRGLEKKAGIKEAELLYAFLDEDRVIDVAKWIWDEMADFRTKSSAKAALPYAHMITRMCIDAKVKRLAGDLITPGVTGPISATTRAKSMAMSSAAKAVSPFKPKGKSYAQRAEEWLQAIFCRQSEIKETQKKIIREQKKTRKRVEYCMTSVEAQTGIPYVSDGSDDEEDPDPPMEEEEDEEEEEGSDDEERSEDEESDEEDDE